MPFYSKNRDDFIKTGMSNLDPALYLIVTITYQSKVAYTNILIKVVEYKALNFIKRSCVNGKREFIL